MVLGVLCFLKLNLFEGSFSVQMLDRPLWINSEGKDNSLSCNLAFFWSFSMHLLTGRTQIQVFLFFVFFFFQNRLKRIKETGRGNVTI